MTYLTAIFPLRVTRRKSCAIERVYTTVNDLYWQMMLIYQPDAEAIIDIDNEIAAARIELKQLEAGKRKDRLADQLKTMNTQRRELERFIAKVAAEYALNTGKISEPVATGLARNVWSSIESYIGLRAGRQGDTANYPTPDNPSMLPNYAELLDTFAGSTNREQESESRKELLRRQKDYKGVPILLARERDTRLIRLGDNGKIATILNILRASDPRSRKALIRPGVDATTGEMLNAMQSATRLIIPIDCSKWHEQKFFSGKASLKSSLIVKGDDRNSWNLHAQFEFSVNELELTGNVLGVDRGIVNPIAISVVDTSGKVLDIPDPQGGEMMGIIRAAALRKRARNQRFGITSSVSYNNTVNDLLHRLANQIVALAKRYGAKVVFEQLDSLKAVKKGNWGKSLKAAQLGKLETIVNYKLRLAGLPLLQGVPAYNTSNTCPRCSHSNSENRSKQVFCCLSCGLTAHADSVAAINIARRLLAMQRRQARNSASGKEELTRIEQEIASQLRSKKSSGLGPLVAYEPPVGLSRPVRTADHVVYAGFPG